MLHLAEEADVVQVRVLKQRVEGVHGKHRNVAALEQRLQFGRAAPGDLVRHHAVQGSDVLRACRDVGKTRVGVEPRGLADRLEERAPLHVGVDQATHMAIGGLVGPALGRQQARVTEVALGRYKGLTIKMVAQHLRNHGLEHRYVDTLAAPGLRAPVQRGAYHAKRIQPNRTVGDRNRQVTRDVAAADAHGLRQGASGLDQVVEGGAGGVPPALRKAEHAGVDQARVQGRQCGVVQSQALHGLRPHVVGQNIGGAREVLQCGQAIGRFEVQRDAALVAVHGQKQRPHLLAALRAYAAHDIAFG